MTEFIDMSTLENISIVDFLSRLGHHPVKKSGREFFYHSMLRETKKDTPSLTVWDAGGKWIDRGGPGETNIKGGGIVQLGLAYWPQLPFVEVLHKIREVNNMDTSLIPEYRPPEKYVPETEEAGYKFELVNTRPIGSNYVLTQYLKSRGILDVANDHLSEVYYRRTDRSGEQPVFYAIGWQNEHGNWEFSNAKGFKSSIGAKGVSIVEGSPDHVVLFEGRFDFLSWLKEKKPEPQPTAIILNSIVYLDKVIDRIRDIPKIDIYFDNDAPGRKCTSQLIGEIGHAVDRSYEYQGYKDYNEKIKNGMEPQINPAMAAGLDQQNLRAVPKR
jgi:hypothetical protein